MTTTNLFTNRATAKIAADVASNDTAITLVAGGGALFPAPGANQYFRLVLQKGTAATDQREYMTCTNVTGDVLTVSRGEEGTPAAAFTVGDEVSLVITAKSSAEFTQKQGVTLQGALEVEAAPTTPLGIANKAWVESGRVNDAPADGKDYARKDLAWHALGAAANLPIPVPVSAGGTGGTTVGAAQTNLVIGVTSIDDLEPAIRKYGDRWIKPSNMTELVWVPNQGTAGTGVWINPMDAQSEAYPIPVEKGGTGATTIKQALINLGIADHDSIKVTVGATDVNVNVFAKGAGGGVSFGLYKTTTGNAALYGFGGTAGAPQPRWGTVLGNSVAEAGANAGSDYVVSRFADNGAFIDNPLNISRATGVVTLPSGLASAKLLLGDGTLAAPALAWTSEPGMGWFRSSLNSRFFATGGQTVESMSGDATNSFLSVFPRTNGGNTQFTLHDNVQGTALQHQFYMRNQGGTGYILGEALQGGSTPARTLQLAFPAGILTTGPVSVQGNVTINDNAGVFRFGATGGSINLDANNGFPALQFSNSNTYTLVHVRSAGDLVYQKPGSPAKNLMTIFGNETGVNFIGDITTSGIHNGAEFDVNVGKQFGLVFRDTALTTKYISLGDPGYGTQFQMAFVHDPGTWAGIRFLLTAGQFQFDASGNGRATVPGPWAALLSDARVKERIEDYTEGLDAILALRVREFSFRSETGMDPTKRHIGLIAQESGPLQQKATVPGLGSIKLDDPLTYDNQPLSWQVINAIKTLNDRLTALEHA